MIETAKPKIVLPAISRGLLRDARRAARKSDGRWHPTMGVGVVLEPDGTIARDGMGEWTLNNLLDEGEQDVTAVYFLQQTDLTKYLALLKGTQPADTDTLTFLAGATNGEVATPASGGYNRQQVLNTDWGTPALNSGDYQTTAAQKTFGPNAGGSSWLVTSVSLVSSLTSQISTGGKHLINTATSAQPTTIVVGQSFLWTQTCKAQ